MTLMEWFKRLWTTGYSWANKKANNFIYWEAAAVIATKDMLPKEDTQFVLLQEDVDALGPYGAQLVDLNKRRKEITKSLTPFSDSGLDLDEIWQHMTVLWNDAKKEAHKLAVVTQQLDMSQRPDQVLKEQIAILDGKIQIARDQTVRENLIETANSKTKQLIELGKIAVYKARVETKVTRLDAFLSELQMGVIRASLEESPEYQQEIATSVKSIRSSFAAVEDVRESTRLLTESADKQNEEVPYYIRYRQVWSHKPSEEVAEKPENPTQTPAPGREHSTDELFKNTRVGVTAREEELYERWRREEKEDKPKRTMQRPDPHCRACGAFISEVEQLNYYNTKDIEIVQCPKCHRLLRFNYSLVTQEVLACPHCKKGTDVVQAINIDYNDGNKRYICKRCGKYFIAGPNLKPIVVWEGKLSDQVHVFDVHVQEIQTSWEERRKKKDSDEIEWVNKHRGASDKHVHRPLSNADYDRIIQPGIQGSCKEKRKRRDEEIQKEVDFLSRHYTTKGEVIDV